MIQKYLPMTLQVPNGNQVIILFLLLGNLFFKFEFIIMPGLAIGLFVAGVILLHRRSIQSIGVLVLVNYLYWGVSGLLTGAIGFPDLLSLEFINQDGRIFVYYMPLLLLSVIKLSKDDLKFTVATIRWITGISTVFFILWVVFNVGLFTGHHGHYFINLHTSHNAAGTFLGILAVFHLIYWLETKERISMVLAFSGFLMMFSTGSREALVSAAIVIAWYLSKNLLKVRTVALGFVVALLILILPLIASRTYERTVELFDMDLVLDIKETILLSNWKPDVSKTERNLPGENINVLARIAYWKYGVERILDSPVTGIGYGRWNDPNPVWVGAKNFAYFATNAERVFNQMHGHNSYIHIWAESGVVGLGLILALWISVFRYFKRKHEKFRYDPSIAPYFLVGQAIVLFVCTSALVAHAFAAPAIGLITTTILGVGFADCDDGSENDS